MMIMMMITATIRTNKSNILVLEGDVKNNLSMCKYTTRIHGNFSGVV
jgi:hypothetical protein